MLPYFTLTKISAGHLTLQVWGFFVALGFLWALSMSLRAARRNRLDEDVVWSVMILALLGMIVGGRIFYLISDPAAGPSAWLDTHRGFSLLGGAVLAGVTVLAYLRFRKQDYLRFFDLLTPGFIVALLWTRVGCLLVGDHVGRLTALPWGMLFADGSIRHPVALYEIGFLLLALLGTRLVPASNRTAGYLGSVFFLTYAAFRLVFDFLRCDDLGFCDPRPGGLTATQWLLLLSLPAFFFLRSHYRAIKK